MATAPAQPFFGAWAASHTGALITWLQSQPAAERAGWAGLLADSLPDAEAKRMRDGPKFHIDQQVDFKPVFDAPVKPEETRFTPPDI